MQQIWLINNPKLNDDTAVAVYSSQYESISIRLDSLMFENDGECPGASFWGVDKARSNNFITVDIVYTEKRYPQIGEKCLHFDNYIYTANEFMVDDMAHVVIASTGNQSPNNLTLTDLRSILMHSKELISVYRTLDGTEKG